MDQEVGRTISAPFANLSLADPTPNGSEAAYNDSCDRLGARHLADGSGARRLASPEFIVPIAVLIVFNLVVVVGNTLVILAVSTHVKLRTATNTFIISLAVADLLVGLTVLPFSSANEVLRYWPFGMTWCSIWLAIDVWMCTASILSLCAISLDRYLAISRPFKYPRLMSQARASLLVAGVWLLSFLICFPPLIGWKERHQRPANGTSGIRPPAAANVSGFATPSEAPDVRCPAGEPVVCELTSEPGYIIYSALGSFWIPVWIMTFFYWKIYRTAAKTTGAIRRGVLTTRTGCTQNSPDAEVTLRVHRGGASGDSTKYKYRMNNDHAAGGRHLVEVSPTTARAAMRKSSKTPSIEGDAYHHQQKQLQPKPGNGHRPDGSPCAGEKNGYFHRNNRIRKQQKQPRIRIKFSKPQANGLHGIQTAYGERQPLKAGRERRHSPMSGCYDDSDRDDCRPEVAERGPANAEDGASDGRSGGGAGGGFLNKVSRIQFRTHMKRMNKEKKAAKTVGIIVGCFVVCWAPFFTVYLLGAFCLDCTPATLFTVFFWLGYCNSAVNPCLYAMCSKDFRYAFKKLLRCRVERRQTGRRGTRFVNFLNSIRIQISTRGSDSVSD